MQAYSSGNFFNLITGRGIGFLTDVGFYIKLGNNDLRYIPIFHNGYIFLLVKTGIIGLILYLTFLLRVINFANAMKSDHNINMLLTSRMTVGLTIILLITTVPISGLFNKSATIPVILIIGACLSHLYSHKNSILYSTSDNISIKKS